VVSEEGDLGECVADPENLVYVVDDDPSVCAAIEGLLRSVGLTTHSFTSPRDFLNAPSIDVPACLVLDVGVPGTFDGLALQGQLIAGERVLPIIFISGRGDIAITVRAIKAGAVGFLPKPFRDQDLLGAVREALDGARRARRAREEQAKLRNRHASLTPRQSEVLDLVVEGLLNKHIADRLGISLITVKIHRAEVMKKMQANSVADLVRMIDRLGPSP
jgi:FixJ family two-component response regulator